MTVSTAGFVCNDALIKSLAGDVPLFQAILVRGVIATTLIGLLAWHAGALKLWPNASDRRVISWRMVGEVGTTALFLTALFNMPLANVTAILQVAPLAMTLAAAWFLGEPVGWRRYLAIGIGFAGVLLIVRPGGEGFNPYTLVALAAVVFLVLRDLSTRKLSTRMPSLLVTLLTAASITVIAGGVTAVRGWAPMDSGETGQLAAAAVFLLVGYHAGVLAMRHGDVGAVSPFRYTNLIWAIGLGWAVFSEIPDVLTLAGAAIVVATGLYTIYRERRVAARIKGACDRS